MDENNFDIEKIMNVINVFNSLNKPKDEIAGQTEQKEDIHNEFSALSTIKAAVPYLNEKYQKSIGIMIKIMEIERLVNNFQAMSLGENDIDRQIKMLNAIKPEIDQRKQKIIDVLIRVIEINNIMGGLTNA